MKLKTITLLSVFSVGVGIPWVVSGAVLMTEVMYDLEGSDGGYEWVELTNTGGTPVDVGDWRLVEGGTNHKLSVFKGTTSVLQPGASALIADNPANVLARYPEIGTVFDSTFSLSNEGETIVLKNAVGTVVDQLTYRSSLGANGNGASLHLEGEVLRPALPNPGVYPGELVPVAAPSSVHTETPEGSGAVANAYTAVTSAPTRAWSLWPWLLGLLSIIGMGVAGVLLVKFEPQPDVTTISADEFEIVE